MLKLLRLFLISFLVALPLIALDQMVLTKSIPGTELRYSTLTTQRSAAVGFFNPSCKAAAYRLTWISRWNLPQHSVEIAANSTWRKGQGFLKLATWGCGLAFYDHGGTDGRIKKMYKWGEGLSGSVTWLMHEETPCGELAFLLIQHARLLCVSGAAAPLHKLKKTSAP